MSLSLQRLTVTALTALALAQPAFAGQAGRGRQAKIDRALSEALSSGEQTQRVIISVKPGFRDGIRDALRKHGDVIKAEHPSVDAISAVVHTADVTELAKHPNVTYLSIDATVYAGAVRQRPNNGGSLIRNVLTSSLGSGGDDERTSLRETLGLPARPSPTTVTGEGVTVAIIDSGIDPRSGFGRRITAFYDFTRGGIPTEPYDDFGHGTHIAGLIGESSSPYMGVAPDVNFVGLKVLDKDGKGSTSDVIRALEYVTVNHERLGVQIVNLSLGHPIYAPASHDPLVAAVERATDAGLIVVASAGNFGINEETGKPGYTGITSPGNAPSAITVGAVDTMNTVTRNDDVVAKFSSRGPTWFDGFAKPDVVAPGAKLVSDARGDQTLFNLLPLNQVLGGRGRDYLQLSGTSMAAGVTSGVVALLVDAHNRAGYWHATPLSANTVKAILEYSAIPVAGADFLTQGTGEINAGGAMALASAIDTSARPGTWWLRMGVPAFTTIGRVQYDWSRQVIWGHTVYTGNLMYYNVKAWSQAFDRGDNIVWGTAAGGDNIVWGTAAGGDNIVWGTVADGDNIVWGTNIVWSANLVWTDRVLGQRQGDNIVWGTADGDNIVWGTLTDDNIVWGTMAGDNIVFGTFDGDNIVWGTFDGDNIVWGTAADLDNIVWGTAAGGDNIVWGTSLMDRQGGIF